MQNPNFWSKTVLLNSAAAEEKVRPLQHVPRRNGRGGSATRSLRTALATEGGKQTPVIIAYYDAMICYGSLLINQIMGIITNKL